MKPLTRELLFSVFLASIAFGSLQAADVVLKVSSTAGGPGDLVVVEFRGTFSQPVVAFEIHFTLSESVAAFLGTEVYDTASYHASGTDLIYNTDRVTGEFVTGVRFNMQNPAGELGPGEDLLLVKAVLQILPGTPPHEVAITVQSAEFTGQDGQNLSTRIENAGVLSVLPQGRPSPVRIFRCSQSGEEVLLTWRNSEVYDSLLLESGSGLRTFLSGTDTAFRDHPPLGVVSYYLKATRGGQDSSSGRCSLTVQPLLVPEINNFTCSSDEEGNHLRWENGAAYDSILVLRNDRKIALLDWSPQSFDDPIRSDLMTIYTLRASVGDLEALPATCRANEFSPEFTYWAEEVRANPGDRLIPLRVFATNSDFVQGMQIGLRINPSLITIRDLTLDQTASEAAGYYEFFYQRHRLGIGQTAAGILFLGEDPPNRYHFPPGKDQHILTIRMDIKPDAPQGVVVPVQIGTFGDPLIECKFTINGMSEVSETRSGAILIGASPVPEVENLVAEVKKEDPNLPDGGAAPGQVVALSWTNAAPYSSIRIERDAVEMAVVAGDSASFVDRQAGPGTHRYRVMPRQGDRQAFPTVALALPRGVPGTFLRGDANSDDHVDILDAITILKYLFLGDRQLSCLDAADADDSGRIDLSDPISLVQHLFQGGKPLPAPGPQTPWFDPTPDELPCR